MLEITLRPTLLAYRDTITLGGVVLILDITYHARTDDWWISFLDEELSPITEGRRVVTGWPLNIGVRDDRMPDGLFLAVRIGEGEADARTGELGRQVRLVFLDADDVASLSQTTSPLVPRAVLSVESAV